MPAIEAKRRALFAPELEPLLLQIRNFSDLKDGDITYLITKIVVEYIVNKGKSYKSLKDVDGILGTASKEFYRQITAKYEDQKFSDNDPEDSIYGVIR